MVNERCSGWTLKEAVRRIVAQPLIARCLKAEHALSKIKDPRHQPFFMILSDPTVDKLLTERRLQTQLYESRVQDRNAAFAAVWAEFTKPLMSGSLVAVCRRGGPAAKQIVLPTSSWRELEVSDWQLSTLSERTGSGATLHQVRVFPALDAPNALDLLTDATIVEAFQKFVFGDPQVARLRNISLEHGGEPFRLGDVPRLYQAIWPLDFGTNDEWKSRFLSRRWDRNGGARTRAADRVLCRRFQKLTSLFRAGQVVVVGLDRREVRQPLPRSIWARKQTYLDLHNGDLVEAADGNSKDLKYRPLFKALMLEQPDSADRAIPPRNRAEKRARAPGRVARALPNVLRRHRITGKGDRSWVEIANIVGGDMPNPPKTAENIKALATAIKRHFDNLNKNKKR